MSIIDDENEKSKFEIIYYTYRKRMFAMANSVLHNKDDAEDVVHDTFIKIARNIQSIDKPESDRTLSYVLKATKNTAINLHNQHKRTDVTLYSEQIEALPDEDFIEKLDIENNYSRIIHAILQLDDTYKDVMFYHFVQEMKVDQIADLLERKKSTIKQQLVRGKKILIEKLEKD